MRVDYVEHEPEDMPDETLGEVTRLPQGFMPRTINLSDTQMCSTAGCATSKHWRDMVYIDRRWWCCISCMRNRKT